MTCSLPMPPLISNFNSWPITFFCNWRGHNYGLHFRTWYYYCQKLQLLARSMR
jgi:hypothetical protein